MVSQMTGMRPVMRRPLPLSGRTDLQARKMTFRGTPYWTVKDPVSLRYYRLREEQYILLTQLDGRRTLEELQGILQQKFPRTHWSLAELQALISDLHDKRLVTGLRSGQTEGIQTQRRKTQSRKIFSALTSLLFIRLPGIYPEPFLRIGYPWIRWAFGRLVVLSVLVLVVSSLGLLAVQFDTARRQIPEFQQFFAWPNLLYLWMTISVVKVIHELGHGFTCHHFGSESHAIGPMLLVFTPTLYCDVSDSWMLADKWKRIAIAGAGIFIEIFLSSIALFAWWYTETGLLHHLALNVFFITVVTTVIFNANPLMRFDGYYILSDLLEIPNLQQRASQFILDWTGWNCFGIETRTDPFEPERARGWVIGYALCSGVYRWIVMFGIAVFLYTVLRPYRLENLGVMLMIVSVGTMVARFGYQVVKMIRAPRTRPLSRGRMAATALVAALIFLAIAQIPVPVYVQAAVMIQPHDVKHVYTKTPGLLTKIRAQSGDAVQAGQQLASLKNPELDDRLRELELEIAVQEQRRFTAAAERKPAREQLAKNALASRNRELLEVRRQIERLNLTSPADGTVVLAQRQPKPQHSEDDVSLDAWYGDPLDPHNQGAFLETNTHLCSIAPDDRFEVVLYIDQSDRNELENGQRIRIKFDHLPQQICEGTVVEVSEKSVAYLPHVLSNKTGGPLATVTESDGRERLTSVAWQARVLLDDNPYAFVSGLRGRARFLVSSRPLGSWLRRWLRRTVHFRL